MIVEIIPETHPYDILFKKKVRSLLEDFLYQVLMDKMDITDINIKGFIYEYVEDRFTKNEN